MNHELIRSYSVGLYTLQDEFITSLKSAGSEGKGQIQEPKMTLKDDGTQEFTFKIPMYIRDSDGILSENPNWYNTQNGNLIVGLKKVKVVFDNIEFYADAEETINKIFADKDGEFLYITGADMTVRTETNDAVTNRIGYLTPDIEESSIKNKVFEFVINKVTETHSDGMLVCEVEANGLAFEELGKNGRTISLNSDLYDLEFQASFDGIINIVNPYYSQENCFIDEEDYDGYDIKLDFMSSDNKLQSTAEINFNLDTAIPIRPDTNYVFSFSSSFASDDIKWSIFGLERHSLEQENKYTFKLSQSTIDKYQTHFPIVFERGNETDIPIINNFKLVLEEEIKANLNFWMDKVVEGTDWTYTVQMDWSSYDGVMLEIPYEDLTASEKARLNNDRESQEAPLRRLDTIYEDEYVKSWALNEDGDNISVEPSEIVRFKEKERVLDESESNRYNLTQAIAEKFEVNCRYKYYYDERLHIVKKEIIFFNNFLKDQKPFDINYPYDSDEISREMDSTDIVTKLYVTDIDDDTNVVTGKVSIVDAQANKSGENYILNFDYLNQMGIISKDQYDEVAVFEAKMHKYNKELTNLSTELALIQTDLYEQKANVSYYAQALAKDSDQIEEAEKMLRAITNNDANHIIEIGGLNYDRRTVMTNAEKQQFIRIYNTGILVDTLKIYKSNEFIEANLVSFGKIDETSSDVTIVYLNAGENLPQTAKLVYAQYSYQPVLYYTKLKDTYETLYEKDLAAKEEAEETLKERQESYEEKTNALNLLLKEKKKVMADFERFMGPAIREGSWQDDDYTDHGNREEATLLLSNGYEDENNSLVKLIFDEEELDGEQKNYYLSGALQEKIYYPYIVLGEEDLALYNEYGDDLCVIYGKCWEKLPIKVDFSDSGTSYVRGDKDTIIGVKIDNTIYDSWSNAATYNIGNKVYYNQAIYKSIMNGNQNRAPEFYSKAEVFRVGSHLIPFILKDGDEFKPIFVIAREGYDRELFEINPNYALHSTVFEDGELVIKEDILSEETLNIIDDGAAYTVVYPRVAIYDMNLKSSDDINFYCYPSIQAERTIYDKLEKFVGFSIYAKYSEIKNDIVTDDCFLLTIKAEVIFSRGTMECDYYIEYNTSNAAVAMYLDALKVSKENAFPKVSYEVKITTFNKEIIRNLYERLDQICYINDAELKFKGVRGYISEIEMDLDNPWEDSITIQNYKTKFEDLFSSIVASTEQMKTNGAAYNIAANAFLSTGALTAETLQQAINQNNIDYNFDNGLLSIDEEEGIWARTLDGNGKVSGVVAIRGGGISIANELDENNNWKWHTGITPSGINASLINAGQLDTELIKIFAGNQVAFQLNAQGLFAYHQLGGNTYTQKEYVVHNGDGLFLTDKAGYEFVDEAGEKQVLDDDIDRVEISWRGLILRNLQNEEVFYADNEGNLTLAGQVNADGGYIGDWLIQHGGLVSSDGKAGIMPSGDKVLWVNNELDETIFSIGHDGIIRGTSAIFDKTVIANDVVVKGVPMSALINAVNLSPQLFSNLLTNNTFRPGIQDNVKVLITQTGIDDYDEENIVAQILGYDEEYDEEVWYDISSDNYTIEYTMEGAIFVLNKEIMKNKTEQIRFVYDNYETNSIELLFEDTIIFVRVICDTGLISRSSITSKNLHAYINVNGTELSDDEAKEQYEFEWYAICYDKEQIEKKVYSSKEIGDEQKDENFAPFVYVTKENDRIYRTSNEETDKIAKTVTYRCEVELKEVN